MGRIIGIDLGTSYSAVAIIDGGAPRILPNALGQRLTPSVVRFQQDGPPLVGEAARRSRIIDAKNTVIGIKRLMGRRYNEVFDLARRIAYKLVAGPDGHVMVEAHGRQYSPPEISALILKSLKLAAEESLGEPVSEAVITVPAYFGHSQRQATYQAGELAGLCVKRLVVEPSAAAMDYGTAREELVTVFDLGGGTFDVSILELGEKVAEVLTAAGDGFLGGDNFDECIARWIVEEIRGEANVDLASNPEAMQRIRDASESAKIELSQLTATVIRLPYLYKSTGGEFLHFERILSRDLFEELCAELFERLEPPCRQALRDAGKDTAEITRVLLIGGATRMPRVREMAGRIFGKNPSFCINPDESVALGAAVQAGVLDGSYKDILLLDATAVTLGIELADGRMKPFIIRSTLLPTRKSDILTTVLDDQDSVEVHVVEGEHKMARDNRSLGRLVLRGIPAAARGLAQIEVTFDIDANSRCNVTVKERSSGRAVSQPIGLRLS